MRRRGSTQPLAFLWDGALVKSAVVAPPAGGRFIICCPFAMWPRQWQGLVLPCFWKFNLLSDATEIIGNGDKVERKPSAFPTSFWRCCLRAMTVKYQSPYFLPCPIILYLRGIVTAQMLPSNYTCTKVTLFTVFSLPWIIVSIHRREYNRTRVGSCGGGEHFQRYL